MSLGAQRYRREREEAAPWRACRGKVRYRDEHAADRVRRECERARGRCLRAYFCEFCEGWHLTRQNAK